VKGNHTYFPTNYASPFSDVHLLCRANVVPVFFHTVSFFVFFFVVLKVEHKRIPNISHKPIRQLLVYGYVESEDPPNKPNGWDVEVNIQTQFWQDVY
jgi:hypothetical protein